MSNQETLLDGKESELEPVEAVGDFDQKVTPPEGSDKEAPPERRRRSMGKVVIARVEDDEGLVLRPMMDDEFSVVADAKKRLADPESGLEDGEYAIIRLVSRHGVKRVRRVDLSESSF